MQRAVVITSHVMGNKMTREEAIVKYMNASSSNDVNAKNIIYGLEALGLIEFEEEIKCWYRSENHNEWGTVRIIEHDEELHLWIGGIHRYKLSVDDV